jgi:hypothetical protein
MSYADRAITPEQKREVLDRLFIIWSERRFESMRLGQLIVNAVRCYAPDVFYREDFALMRDVEGMTDRD